MNAPITRPEAAEENDRDIEWLPIKVDPNHAVQDRRDVKFDYRLLRYVGPFLMLVISGMAHLTGAPPFIVLGLIAVGLASLAFTAQSVRLERRKRSQLDESAARSRAEMEHLADRVWELQESEERFRGLIDALGDLVIHRDRAGRLVYANKVFADLTGREPRHLVGKTLDELRHQHRRGAERSLRAGRLSEFDRCRDPDARRSALVFLDRAFRARQGQPHRLASRDRARYHQPQTR
jgi:PAS domain-containing protein